MNIQEIRQKYPQYQDLSDEQLAQSLHKKFYADMPVEEFNQKIGFAPDPTAGMSGTDKFLAGAGKAFTDLGRGAHQAAGELAPYLMAATGKPTRQDVGKAIGAPTRAEMDAIKQQDAPLMKTGAGFAGNLAGNVAGALPLALTPGANTGAGAALIGSGLSMLQPVGKDESRTLNTILGGAFGYAGNMVGAKAIPAAINWAKGKVAGKLAEKTANAARDATVAEARQAGFVLPPSEVKPGVVSNLLERWAGKASVGQQASLKNQQVTNKLVRQTLGLPDDVPITPEALLPVKQAAWNVYDQVRNLGQLSADDGYRGALAKIGQEFNKVANEFPELGNSGIDDLIKGLSKDSMSSDGVVEAIKVLRHQASTNQSALNMNPAAKSLGKAQSAAADALEDLIDRNIQLNQEIAPNASIVNLLRDYRNARVTLGKVGTVERAMVESTGDVSARKLAAQLSKGKPLSGEMRTAAKFAQAFPKLTQQNINPVPGGSPLDAMAAIGASAATSNPAWLSLALGRPAARSAVLSPMFAGAPNYSPGITAKTLPYLLEPLNNRATAQGMGLLGPSIYATQQ